MKAATIAAVLLVAALSPARAQHVCDAPGDDGSRVLPSVETTDVKDGAPYREGGDWLVERTITLLPMCNYFSPVGSYSLKSYSLDPFTKTERIVLCHGASAVAPYAGPCPPR